MTSKQRFATLKCGSKKFTGKFMYRYRGNMVDFWILTPISEKDREFLLNHDDEREYTLLVENSSVKLDSSLVSGYFGKVNDDSGNTRDAVEFKIAYSYA